MGGGEDEGAEDLMRGGEDERGEDERGEGYDMGGWSEGASPPATWPNSFLNQNDYIPRLIYCQSVTSRSREFPFQGILHF